MDGSPTLAEAFAALARGADDEVDLARAALTLGRIVEPDLAVDDYVDQLGALAQRVNDRWHPVDDDRAALDALRTALFQEAGFAGADGDYYDPANSYLHMVLRHRRGLPITLAVVVLEVGRRAGLTLAGVGTPGHFLVKQSGPAGARFLDPFHACAEIDAATLRERLAAVLPAGQSPEAYLDAVTKRQMLTRIVTNLKAAYLRRRDYEGALAATEHLLALAPWSLDEIRDRGFLHVERGREDQALLDLRAYVEHARSASDRDRVQEVVRRLEERAAARGRSPDEA